VREGALYRGKPLFLYQHPTLNAEASSFTKAMMKKTADKTGAAERSLFNSEAMNPREISWVLN
jgi:hypothetical protein